MSSLCLYVVFKHENETQKETFWPRGPSLGTRTPAPAVFSRPSGSSSQSPRPDPLLSQALMCKGPDFQPTPCAGISWPTPAARTLTL